jgi:hypothetical protein
MTVQAGAGVMPCPDGKSRVAVQFAVDNSQYLLVIDAEVAAADAFADQLAASIKQAAAEARRANSGLIVPGAGMPQVGPLPPALRHPGAVPTNGHG